MTRLDQAFRAGFFLSFIAIEADLLYSVHFVLPFLANDLKQSFRGYVLVRCVLALGHVSSVGYVLINRALCSVGYMRIDGAACCKG